jgi:hypothetical protein
MFFESEEVIINKEKQTNSNTITAIDNSTANKPIFATKIQELEYGDWRVDNRGWRPGAGDPGDSY